MIIRGKRKPASTPVEAGLPIGKITCINGDPSCDTKQGCLCFPKESARMAVTAHTRKNVSQAKTGTAQYRSRAQRAVIDRALSSYYLLTCGCYVTHSTAKLYSVFSPLIKDVFCETHNDFFPVTKTQKTVTYPVNPLF